MTTGVQRTLALAVATGLRSTFGPAFVAHSAGMPARRALALMALGECVFDKLPFAPSRDTPLPTAARGIAAYWAASRGGGPRAGALAAAVAMGVSLAAPKLRRRVAETTGVQQALVGVAEDAIALGLGAAAVGLTWRDVSLAAGEAVGTRRGAQSAGAGSM